jgi:hypothetical protein
MVNPLASINDTVVRLGYFSPADAALSTAWVTQTELYQFADDAAKQLAYKCGVFVGCDTSIAVTAGVGVYALPASHVFTLLAWIAPAGAGSNAVLRPTSVLALWALDETWPTTTGEAKRCSFDAGAVGTITIYPIPVTSGTLNQICEEFPPTVQFGSTVNLPTVMQAYLTYAMLAGAFGKESDHALAEMASHFKSRCDLYEQLAASLWGPGQ